jgi:hypothetical protein
MSPERLPEVRYNVLRTSAAEATTLARRVLGVYSAGEVERLLCASRDPWHKLLSAEERAP